MTINNYPSAIPEHVVFETPDVYIRVCNNLYSVPLYAWYVVLIDKYEAGDIQGILLTCPIEFEGPFESKEIALQVATSLMDNS